jgi:hypothetical protein
MALEGELEPLASKELKILQVLATRHLCVPTMVTGLTSLTPSLPCPVLRREGAYSLSQVPSHPIEPLGSLTGCLIQPQGEGGDRIRTDISIFP